MSTKVEPTVDPTVETEDKSEAQALLADATVVSDKVFVKLMGAVDTHQLKVGGKWAELIEHCINTHFKHLQTEFKDLPQEAKDELKAGKGVVLKSLLEMGKTESSAYSIRSYIIKMSKPENAETLAKLKAGDITVRASREAGRTPQSNPGLSNEEKYRRALNDVVRFAVALKYTGAKIGDDAETAWNEYQAKVALEAEKKS